ncbi:hypothetical protein BGZ94_004455 [Podila epigama]|nr:hypothetical protein BGZ94_004455 [Podila epigama]
MVQGNLTRAHRMVRDAPTVYSDDCSDVNGRPYHGGKTFPKPERVPFRLTHNMVDAMGLSGYEGTFRLICELTLRVFRANIESLTSVLEGFVHDPLVEWAKSGRKRGQQVQLRDLGNAGGGSTSDLADSHQREKAHLTIYQIRKKLIGTDTANGQQLSVEGQVQELIQTATSPENLAKMYIGWSAYM